MLANPPIDTRLGKTPINCTNDGESYSFHPASVNFQRRSFLANSRREACMDCPVIKVCPIRRIRLFDKHLLTDNQTR
jgi:hypothetical protein